jgi:hypothetical protein
MVGRSARMLLFLSLFGPVCSSAFAQVAAGRAAVRRPISPPAKVLRYTQRVVDEHDANGDGELQESEWERMDGNPRLIDRDRDGVITAKELAEHIARYGYRRRIRLMPASTEGAIRYPSLLSPDAVPNAQKKPGLAKNSLNSAARNASASATSGKSSQRIRKGNRKFTVPQTRLPKGLPSWFLARDADGDAQVTLAEYAPDVSRSALLEFTRYDANSDGVITAQEALRSPRARVIAGAKPASIRKPSEEKPAADTTESRANEPSPEDIEARRLKKEQLRRERLNSKNKSSGKSTSNTPSRNQRDRRVGGVRE